MDGTTDVGETPLRIEFDNSGMPVGEQALIDDVAQAAHLEGPGGEAIPFTYDVVDADGSDDHTPAYVEVHPSSDLEDTCYSLWLDAAPSWAAEPTYPAHVDLKDRGPGVRFCVGSRPVISFFRICESDGELKVIADFSERMEVRAGLDRALKPSIDGQGCAMVPLIADQASYGDLHYDCGDGVLAGELVVQASEPSSLVGLSGVRLRSFPIDSPLDWRFSVQELPQWGANCWIARPGSAP